MEPLLKNRTSILLLSFVVLAVYYPTIFAPLNSVDDPGMYHYLLNADQFSFRGLCFPSGSGTYYRPLLAASFFIDKYVWGLQESFMHLQSIFLHLCNTLLVFAIARRVNALLGSISPVPSFLAALFFAVHPINTEAVVWISARTDLLACLFVLMSTWLMVGRSQNIIVAVLAACSFFLACLAKETAIFFLPAAIIFPFFMPTLESNREPWRSILLKNISHIIVFTAAGAGYFLMRDFAFSKGDSGVARVVSLVAGEQTAGLLTSFILILKAAGFYLKKLFIPFPSNFGINHVSDLYMVLGVLVGVLVVLLLKRRTLPGYFFLCAIAVATSALMVPLLRVTWTPLAERYMYIPSAFFLIGLMSFGYPRLKKFRYQKIMVGVIAILAAISIYGSTSRAMLWQDNAALFQDTIRKSPDFLPAQNQYAHALYVSGRQDEAAAILNSLKVPDTLINFQFGMVSKAVARIHDRDYAGARKILRETLKQPGKHEVMIIERLLKLNEVEAIQTGLSRGKFYDEDVLLLTRLYEITGDHYVLYRLGRTHMFNNNSDKARDAFKRVVAQTTEKVYYYAPAKKLWLKLSDGKAESKEPGP